MMRRGEKKTGGFFGAGVLYVGRGFSGPEREIILVRGRRATKIHESIARVKIRARLKLARGGSMAIARCERCGKPTQNVKPPGYSSNPYLPVGHPSSGVVCGKPGCENSALIWLK